jgi:hypothetical protein
MIRYSGWILRTQKEEFLQDIVNADLVVHQTVRNIEGTFFIVYFVDRKDEMYFKLKYPMLKKEIDDATISTIPS